MAWWKFGTRKGPHLSLRPEYDKNRQYNHTHGQHQYNHSGQHRHHTDREPRPNYPIYQPWQHPYYRANEYLNIQGYGPWQHPYNRLPQQPHSQNLHFEPSRQGRHRQPRPRHRRPPPSCIPPSNLPNYQSLQVIILHNQDSQVQPPVGPNEALILPPFLYHITITIKVHNHSMDIGAVLTPKMTGHEIIRSLELPDELRMYILSSTGQKKQISKHNSIKELFGNNTTPQGEKLYFT